MSHTDDFPTAVRLRDAETLDVLLELHDPANGILIGAEVTPPTQNKRQTRRKSSRVRGSYAVGRRVPDDGLLVVPIEVGGSSWAEQQSRWVAVYAVLDALEEFIVETELSGVRTRWLCDAPVDILSAPIDSGARVTNSLDYELRFTVQPNPTVTLV